MGGLNVCWKITREFREKISGTMKLFMDDFKVRFPSVKLDDNDDESSMIGITFVRSEKFEPYKIIRYVDYWFSEHDYMVCTDLDEDEEKEMSMYIFFLVMP